MAVASAKRERAKVRRKSSPTQKLIDARMRTQEAIRRDELTVRRGTKAERDAAQKRLDAAYEAEDKERFEYNEEIRRKVLEQCKGDMIDLHTEDGRKVASVPRAPFEVWALHRTSLKHLAAPWKTVAPSGLKLQMDEPAHTDWFYGATIYLTEEERLLKRFPSAETLDEAKELASAWGVKLGRYDFDYNGVLNEASYHEAWNLQERLGNFEAPVIVDAGDVTGEVGKQIAVIPDLSPDHVDKIVRVKGIVTEVGGKVAHIAQLALERSITIMRVPGAVKRFPEGAKLTLYPGEGRIYVHVDRWW
jgi:phosphohistidine swiveling domain-containing protein